VEKSSAPFPISAPTRRAGPSTPRTPRFRPWRALPAAKRSALLEAWFNAINQHMDDLAKILTVEQGKPLAEAKGEIIYGAGFREMVC
jgi:acyl-CoA reductase-like NAD-dependent aldehyde dehydrogenase